MSDQEFTPSPLEKPLYEMYSAPTPSAEFSNRLRAELLERAKQQNSRRPSRFAVFWSRFNTRLTSAGRVGFSLAGAGLLIALVLLGARLLSQNAPTPPLVGSEIIETQPATLEPTTTTYPITYTVQEGDTWASIAAAFGLTVDELFAVNGLDQNAALFVGQELIVGFTGTMPTPTPLVSTATAEPIAEAHASGQPSLSPEACAAQIPFNLPERISPIHTVPTQILGGGTLTSGDFTFDLYLYCDNIFTPDVSDPSYRSEITGLGVFLRWQYDGPEMTGETNTYTGIEPFVQYRGGTGPSLDSGKGYISTTGLQVPQNILPDWSGMEFALRYVVIAQDPQGGSTGAAVDFRLVREKPGGFMVRDIQIEPLSEAELASPTARQGEPPFPFLQSSDLDPILAEIEDLVLRHEAALTQQPGWIHWRRHITNPEPIQATSPGDVSIPAEYISDEWYRLDENGLVEQSVYRILTMEGQELMAGIYHNGTAYDLTLGTETPYIHTERMKFDFNFYLNAFDAVKSEQKSILKEPVYAADGSYLGEGFTVEISGQIHQAVFNPETGQMLELRVYQPDAPQDSPPYHLTQIEVLEPAELPAELAALFEKEVPDFQPLDPQGTPAPEGFDPAALPLTHKIIPGDDLGQPTFFYGDIYAGDYLLGRVDFGIVPGGAPCDRSADGSLLAFTHTINDQIWPFHQTARLSLLNLRAITDIQQPAPEIVAIGELSWSPSTQRLAVFGCEAGIKGCGLYRFDPAEGSIQKILDDVYTLWQPIWNPDGSQIAFVDTQTEAHTLYVVDFQTGEVVYQGPFDAEAWQAPANSPTHAWGVAFPREADENRCFASEN